MADSLTCLVVTPEQTALEQKCDFVALPLYDGEIGIAPGRSPLIGRLGYGEMRIKTGGVTTTYYVDGGFVQVDDNIVSVLTNRAGAEPRCGCRREATRGRGHEALEHARADGASRSSRQPGAGAGASSATGANVAPPAR
jgi:F0F1-type ATP synthase epsilon subunit